MGTEARLPYLLTNVTGGFAVTLVRNKTQRHSAALKNAGQNPVGLFPLDWKFEDCCSLLYLYLLFHVLLPTQYPICLHSFRTHEQDYSQCT